MSDIRELEAAVRHLETSPIVHEWDLSRIKNRTSSFNPREGVGITLTHFIPQQGVGTPRIVRIFEKAATDDSLLNVAVVALERLRQRIDQQSQP